MFQFSFNLARFARKIIGATHAKRPLKVYSLVSLFFGEGQKCESYGFFQVSETTTTARSKWKETALSSFARRFSPREAGGSSSLERYVVTAAAF